MARTLSIFGFINKGYQGQAIGIECDIRNGFPGFDIVGLPDSAVKESRERVRTALRNSGFKFPQNRVLISLSPASQPKTGSLLDLGIALALLFSFNKTGNVKSVVDENIRIMVAGELKLNGDIIQAPDSLGAIECAKRNNCSLCLIPYDIKQLNYDNVIHVTNLVQAFLTCGELINTKQEFKQTLSKQKKSIFQDVLGLEKEKEILSMAASGYHSTLLFGPPGVGKTMLSKRMHLLLPDADTNDIEEINRIHGCAGITENPSIPVSRFLSHDLSATQFSGGNTSKSPGEGALAHRGVLVLDEANKYSPKLLQAIQTTFDCGYTQSSKSGELVTYPAKFLLLANMNPCACGSLGNPSEICTCTSQKINSHWQHLGWQFIDRFDIRLPIKIEQNINLEFQKSDDYYIEKIKVSSDRQKSRYKSIDNVNYNGEIRFDTQALSCLSHEISILREMNDIPKLNPRSFFSTVALARTIADYDDRDTVTKEDIQAALLYKSYGHGDFYWRQIN